MARSCLRKISASRAALEAEQREVETARIAGESVRDEYREKLLEAVAESDDGVSWAKPRLDRPFASRYNGANVSRSNILCRLYLDHFDGRYLARGCCFCDCRRFCEMFKSRSDYHFV